MSFKQKNARRIRVFKRKGEDKTNLELTEVLKILQGLITILVSLCSLDNKYRLFKVIIVIVIFNIA